MQISRIALNFFVGALCLTIPAVSVAIDSFSTYERAEFYNNHARQQWQVAYEALKTYSFLGNESVLEIGCRGGRVAANLAGRLPQGKVVAMEMRGPGAIAFAKQNHSQDLYPNVSFLEQDFLESEYEEQFDLAVSFSALHWYPEQKVILQKVYRSLKPQGQILFTIPGKPIQDMTSVIAEVTESPEWKPYFENYSHPRRKFTGEEYEALLLDAGFKPLEIRMERHKYYFENKRALIDWFRAFSPIVDRVPEEKKDRFLADFSTVYIKYFPIDTDGQIPFIQDELFIRAARPNGKKKHIAFFAP